MRAYADLDLEITRSGGRCRARVLRSPAGETPNVEFVPPFSRDELQALAPSLTGDRRDIRARRKGSVQDLFRDAGSRLFKAVFADDIRACLLESMTASKGKVLRIRLHLGDPELAGWPWEYLVDHRLDRWLALLPDLSIVRYSEMPEAVEPLEVALPLHVLVVAAARTGRRPLAADREWKHIEDGLSSLRESGQVVLDHLKDASFAALREKLRRGRWHVLHFIGHGGLDRQGEGMLLFEEENGKPEEVSGRDLGALLLSHCHLRLVVLNACEGAREGREEAFSSVAQALVRSRIPAVVAMQVVVSDRAAISFARHFYRELAEGDPLDEVLTLTRQGMFSEGHKVEWGTPVLFLRAESGRIFEIAGKNSVDPEPLALDPGKKVRPMFWWAGPLLALAATVAIGVLSLREPGPPSISVNNTSAPAPVTHPRCPMPRDIDIAFQLIESETFRMGSGSGGDKDERPAHEVTLSESYCIGFNEVTQKQWRTVMGVELTPRDHAGDDLPALGLSYEDAMGFIDLLNQREPGAGYRLPTEAEWEYANHPGTSPVYSLTNVPKASWEVGNCNWKGHDDGFAGPAPVRSLAPNTRGLYDMIGNAQEWVSDWYAPYTEAPATDPTGPLTGQKRVRRGGSWDSKDRSCRPEVRSAVNATTRFKDTGFRIVRAPVSQ